MKIAYEELVQAEIARLKASVPDWKQTPPEPITEEAIKERYVASNYSLSREEIITILITQAAHDAWTELHPDGPLVAHDTEEP
jgi:hypothetical protein